MVAGGSRFGDRHRTGARRGAPPPAPPRSFLTERGEFGRAGQVRRTSLPRAVCGGGSGRGAAYHPALPHPKHTAASPTTNLPRQFRGRWAGGAGPEGGCATVRSASIPAPPRPPPVFFGGGREATSERGRRGAPRTQPISRTRSTATPGACPRVYVTAGLRCGSPAPSSRRCSAAPRPGRRPSRGFPRRCCPPCRRSGCRSRCRATGRWAPPPWSPSARG
jgi:hypothetical protein